MRFLLSKVIIPLHLAVIAAYLAWVQPGPDNVAAYLPLAFLAVGLAQFVFLFPSAKAGEDVDDARGRVLHAVTKDIYFAFGILAVFFVVVQILNGPRNLVYVRAERAWQYTPGIIAGFPAALDQLLSVQALFTIVIVTLSALAIRNSLGAKSRRLLVRLVIGVASLVGLYGLVAYSRVPLLDEMGVKLPAPEVFATFACKTEAGAFFLMNSCAAFGALFMELIKEEDDDDSSNKWTVRFLFVALLVNLAATLFSLSCLSIAVLVITILLLAIYAFVYVLKMSPGELSVTTLAAIIILGAVVGFLHFVAYPENRLHDCTEKIFKGPWQTQAEKDERAALVGAAWRAFDDNRAGGLGASCYGLESGFAKYVESAEWKSIREPDSRHYRCGSDFAQLFAEFGVIGALLLLAPFVLSALRSLVRIVHVMKYGTKRKQGLVSSTATDADRITFFDVVPPDVMALFVAVLSVTVLSFYMPVFGSQINIFTWATFLIVACASLPKSIRSPSRKQ